MECAWLKDYQTLIAGLVVFVGVVLTLWFNAWAARKQRQDERRHERQTLRTALLAELEINRDAMATNTTVVQGAPDDAEGRFSVPAELIDDVYRAFTTQIGLLTRPEVQKVMHACLSLRTYNDKLHRMGDLDPAGRHITVPAIKGRLLAGMFEVQVRRISEAIEALENADNAD